MSKKNICCVFQSSSLSTGGLNWFPLKLDLIETQFPFSIFRHFHLHLKYTGGKKREKRHWEKVVLDINLSFRWKTLNTNQSQLKTFIAGILHGIIPASKMASAEKQHICYSFFRYVFKCILSQNVAAVMLGARVKPWKKVYGKFIILIVITHKRRYIHSISGCCIYLYRIYFSRSHFTTIKVQRKSEHKNDSKRSQAVFVIEENV